MLAALATAVPAPVKSTTEPAKPSFDEAFDKFIADINAMLAKSDLFHPTEVRVRNRNAKYIALDRWEYAHEDVERTGPARCSGVHCFVASANSTTKSLGVVREGDVLKAASFKKPAKHARGNIFDDSAMEWMGVFGPAYLS